MLDLVKRCADGWQYFVDWFSNIGQNFHVIKDFIADGSDYIENFLNEVSFPVWFSSTVLVLLTLGIASKLLHWGR